MDPSVSPFARLPIELRQLVYSHTFSSLPQTTVVGTGKTEDGAVTWPTPQPALAQVSTTIRSECLPVFYATRALTFKLQSRLGFDMAMTWIARCAESDGQSLRKLRYITIIAGPSGYYEPQKVLIDLNEVCIVSMRVQLASHPFAGGQRPAFEALMGKLHELREQRREGTFDMVDALAGIVKAFECMLEKTLHEFSNSGGWL